MVGARAEKRQSDRGSLSRGAAGRSKRRSKEALSNCGAVALQFVTLALAGSAIERRYEIVVVDGLGREIARNELALGVDWRLDVSGWAPGVYHARVERHTAESVSFTVAE